MIKNSMFNLKSYFKKNTNPTNEPDKVKSKTVTEPINNTEEDKEYTFESTAKAQNKDNSKVMRDLLGGTLIALSAMSAPFVYASLDEPVDDSRLNVNSVVINDNDKAILDSAEVYAQDGKSNYILERKEFEKLIDFSKLDSMPSNYRDAIIIQVKAGYMPIDMNSPGAKEEILKQVRNANYMVDSAVKTYKNTPPQKYAEAELDYAINNVTDKEILDKVDFSELELYQKDLTVVKALIKNSRKKINRNDIDVVNQFDKEVANAQKLVDKIVDSYKTRAKISGNIDGDFVLSKTELLSLLKLESINDLPQDIQMRIINKALESYNPRELSHVRNDRQVEITNQNVNDDKEKAQKILDEWAYKAHKEFYHLLHPNELLPAKQD